MHSEHLATRQVRSLVCRITSYNVCYTKLLRLDGLPNVHYALTGFTENSGPVDVMIKKFGEKKINIKKLDGLAAGGGNCDGFNIRSSAKRLLRFKNMKKVMIVISDGQPAYNDGIDDTKKSVKQAEHFGIRITSYNVCYTKLLRYAG